MQIYCLFIYCLHERVMFQACLIVNIPEEQIKLDEEFARQLDNELNQVDVEVEIVVENSDNLQVQSRDRESAEKRTQETLTDHVSVVKELSKSVDNRSILYCGAQGFQFHKMLESVAS